MKNVVQKRRCGRLPQMFAVQGNTEVQGNARVQGNTEVQGNARVQGNLGYEETHSKTSRLKMDLYDLL